MDKLRELGKKKSTKKEYEEPEAEEQPAAKPLPSNGGFKAKATYIDIPKPGMGEKGGDISAMFKKHRTTAGSKTKFELLQLEKLRRVYEGVFGAGSVPSYFKTETKNAFDNGGMMSAIAKNMTGDLFTYNEGYQPDEEYYMTTNWFRGIDAANGKFRPEAKAMINIICTFQSNKAKGYGVEYAGYPDDPENLCLEEFKNWVKDRFAFMVEKDKDEIRKRCGYLEDVLCKEGLFDRPDSGDVHTMQKVVVEVRRILKATIQTIEANLTHVDAGRSLEEIMDTLRLFVDEAASLLWYSFRDRPDLEGQATTNDTSLRLHRAVLSSPQLKQVLAHRSKLNTPPAPRVIGFNDAGRLELHEDYLSPAKANSKAIVVANPQLVEVSSEAQLNKVFVGEESGFDKNFRENAVIAALHLEGYALLLDLGSLYGVLKQAKGAAQTGGTMLLYGAANAHFNALLELTERLADSMRTRCSKIVEIGENRFEQLVELNWATATRCPWIANYRELPRILVQVEKNAFELFKTVAKARSEANALTLKERKEQAEEETQNFLNAADGLTKKAGKSLHITYNSYQAHENAIKDQAQVDKLAVQLKDRDANEKKQEDKKAEEEAKAALAKIESEATGDIPQGNKQYLLTITTSKDIGSGTDADLFVYVTGTKGKTDLIGLPDEDKTRFETGRVDRFDLDVEGDIGDVTALTIGIKSKSLDADWKPSGLEISEKGAQKKYTFTIAKNTVIGGFGIHNKKEITFKAERMKV